MVREGHRIAMAPYAWWQTNGYAFEHLSFVAVHLGALRIGACMAETNWSVRGWMQDKKLNARTQARRCARASALEHPI